MSRIDYLTVGLVALCMAALIFLVYKYVNLGNQPAKPPTAVFEEPKPGSSEDVAPIAAPADEKPAIDSPKVNDAKPLADNTPPTSSKEEDKTKSSGVSTDKTEANNKASTPDTKANAAQTTPSPSPAPEKTTPAPKPTPAPATTTSSSKPATVPGKYMVIAGSYKEIRFAKEMLVKIRKMGYRKAQIEKFNRGAYATILVDRFYSEKPARKMVADLKFNAIDAMMLVKK